MLHGALAWPSAHLLILGYALAGSYEGGLTAWRTYASQRAQDFFAATNDLLDLVGNGAASEQPVPDGMPPAVVRVGEALSLVMRTLWLIWAPIIALLTLSGWLS
jgi:AmpE protein